MSKEVVITNYKSNQLIALFDNNKAIEMFFKSPDSIEIGDLYIGKVKNIVDNIQAAFVEVSPGVVGYYSLKNNTQHLFADPTQKKLRAGDDILVQIERGAIKSKAPVLTSRIQLQGEYLVFLANYHFVGISKKITDTEKRERLKELSNNLIQSTNHGVILRTQASNVSDDILIEEYNRLMVYYNNIMTTYVLRTCYSKIYSMPKNWLNYVHCNNTNDLKVVTDIPEIYDDLKTLADTSENTFVYSYYNDKTYPLIKLKSLETQIERAISKHVWLRSGASLVIEPTEALTCIDVNTSKAEIHTKNEETFLQINLEAAKEVCRQIRLRNLSGIIIVDFINMSDKKNEVYLINILRQYAQEDPVQLNVIDMTPLGLVEMTRKRTYKPFHEQLKEVSYE